MYLNELHKAIQNQTLKPAIMLFGESHFMINHTIKTLCHYYAPEDEPFILYEHEYSLQNAKAFLSQASLFGGHNLLVIKSEKKVPKKDLDILVELTQKGTGNFFIYAYFGDDYKNSNKAFTKKNSHNIRLYAPFFNDAIHILTQAASQKGIHISKNVLVHLYNSQNNDLALSVNELDKLAILNKEIDIKDVDRMVYSLAEVKLDDIITHLLHKKSYVKDMKQLLDSGAEPIMIITHFSGFVTTLFKFLSHIKLTGSANSQEILGYRLPKYVEKSHAELSMRFTVLHYRQILQALLECEYRLKYQAKSDKEAELFATLLKIQKLLP